MTELFFKSAIATTVGLVGLSLPLMTQPAHAFFVTYDFDVNVRSGIYAGNYTGSFQFNQSALSAGPECNDPLNSNTLKCAQAALDKGALTVQFNFLDANLRPKTYTERDDIEYSAGFPAVYFNLADEFRGLGFFVAKNASNPGFFILNEKFYVGTTTYDSVGDSTLLKAATVKYRLAEVPPPPDPAEGPRPNCNTAAVPEPSEVLGSVVALGSLSAAFYLRRRKTAATIDVECEEP